MGPLEHRQTADDYPYQKYRSRYDEYCTRLERFGWVFAPTAHDYYARWPKAVLTFFWLHSGILLYSHCVVDDHPLVDVHVTGYGMVRVCQDVRYLFD